VKENEAWASFLYSSFIPNPKQCLTSLGGGNYSGTINYWELDGGSMREPVQSFFFKKGTSFHNEFSSMWEPEPVFAIDFRSCENWKLVVNLVFTSSYVNQFSPWVPVWELGHDLRTAQHWFLPIAVLWKSGVQLQPRLSGTAREASHPRQGLQQGAKGELAALAPICPLKLCMCPA
jgi:hypothetical protein